MRAAHWTAIGMLVSAVALDVQQVPTFRAMLTPGWLGGVGLHVGAVCVALGARSVFAPEPTTLDALRSIAPSDKAGV